MRPITFAPVNLRENKPLMALTIPVFRGLIASDPGQLYHRYHGSLGWALKDLEQPEWQEAYDELTTAITIRDRFKVAGWRLYEANRALCAMHLIRELPAADPTITSLRELIDRDLTAAQADPYAKEMAGTNDAIQRWMHQPS